MSGNLSPGQVAQYALRAGLSAQQAVTATAIALAESGGNPTSQGDQGTSYGLWQIHWTVHPQFDPSKLFDPAYNAFAMAQLSGNGSNWTPWTTYNNGAYQQYLPTANQAVMAAGGVGINTPGADRHGSASMTGTALSGAVGAGGPASSSQGIHWSGPFGLDLSPVLWGGMVIMGAGIMLAGVAILVVMAVKGAPPEVRAVAAAPGRVARRVRGRQSSSSAGPDLLPAPPNAQAEADAAEARAMKREAKVRRLRKQADFEDQLEANREARKDKTPLSEIPF